MSILAEIFAHKRQEVAARKISQPEAALERALAGAADPPDFRAALGDAAKPAPRLIAEVKHRSPSRGVLVRQFDPVGLARLFAKNGAAAISVLTDEKYFGGKLEYLAEIAHTLRTDDFSRRPVINELVTTQPPLLCKDFIFDEYQILEARAAGAGAALLIAAMLAPASLARLIRAARSLRLTPLVEVHTQEEASLAVDAGADVIGINNRDLHTFRVDLDTTLQLRPLIPPEIIVVAESGIKTAADVQMLADANVDAMLIGEGLVTAEDPAAKAREFSRTEDGRRETETSAAGLPSPVKL